MFEFKVAQLHGLLMWNVLPQDPSVDPQLHHVISLGHRALPGLWSDRGTYSG